MGDMIDGEIIGPGRIIPWSELSREDRKASMERSFKAAAERGEYPEALFGTRQSAVFTAWVLAGCLAVLGSAAAYSIHEESEQKRRFDENVQNIDTSNWPECIGRQAYWRDNCVEPITP